MLIPTMYLRWIQRPTAAPTRVLQQWWGTRADVPPGTNGWPGEWRDVPDQPYEHGL